MKKIIVILVSLVVRACATYSKDECLSNDWQQIGYSDGVRGRYADDLQTHQTTCRDHGVDINEDAYLQGHKQGVKLYCTEGNAYSLGSKGKSYNDVCPYNSRNSFLASYKFGQEMYLRDSLDKINRNIDSNYAQLEYINKQIEMLNSKLKKRGSTNNIISRKELRNAWSTF